MIDPQSTSTLSDDEYIEKVIKINRVNKVVKGGKRLAFRAFCIVGDQNGKVGLALGKSKEVPLAIKQGIERAKKNLCEIITIDGTLPHEVRGKFGSASVLIRPARKGTGVIAGGPVRVLLEAVGFQDVVAKSLGSDNPINIAKAALNGLLSLKNYEDECKIRGKKLPVVAYLKSAVNNVDKSKKNQPLKVKTIVNEDGSNEA